MPEMTILGIPMTSYRAESRKKQYETEHLDLDLSLPACYFGELVCFILNHDLLTPF